MKNAWKFLLALPILSLSLLFSSLANSQARASAAPGSQRQPPAHLPTATAYGYSQAAASPTISPTPSAVPTDAAPPPIHTSKQCVAQSEGLPPASKTAGTLLMHAEAYYPEPILDFRRSSLLLSPVPPETAYSYGNNIAISPNRQWIAYLEIAFEEHTVQIDWW
ncbi:MAG TPA: hypothetical protein VGM23_09290, partial [Armatimonadota bacterium]